MSLKRVLLLADKIHPYIYRDTFPQGLGHLDLVLGAGDLPGDYLEFVATKSPVPVLYVHGNHNEEVVTTELGREGPPGGAESVHGKVVERAGLIVAGWGGAPRYRDGGTGQYTGWEVRRGLAGMRWPLYQARRRHGRAVDIFLTHAAPTGPHEGTDHAHRGCIYLNRFDARYRPQVHAHGHVHEYEGKKGEYTTPEGVRVINGYGYVVVELTVPDRP
ncbi:MAG TPA: phosphohydrolase [Deinococcales bacterium]|nr:phosphohydrolase [Deinococcales bacterium]